MARGLSCFKAYGIFPDQESNHVPWVGRQILIHCATKEVLLLIFEWVVYFLILGEFRAAGPLLFLLIVFVNLFWSPFSLHLSAM